MFFMYLWHCNLESLGFFSCLLVKRNALHKCIVICLQGLALHFFGKLVCFWDDFCGKTTLAVILYHKSSTAHPVGPPYWTHTRLISSNPARIWHAAALLWILADFSHHLHLRLLGSSCGLTFPNLSIPCLHSGFIAHTSWLLRCRI